MSGEAFSVREPRPVCHAPLLRLLALIVRSRSLARPSRTLAARSQLLSAVYCSALCARLPCPAWLLSRPTRLGHLLPHNAHTFAPPQPVLTTRPVWSSSSAMSRKLRCGPASQAKPGAAHL